MEMRIECSKDICDKLKTWLKSFFFFLSFLPRLSAFKICSVMRKRGRLRKPLRNRGLHINEVTVKLALISDCISREEPIKIILHSRRWRFAKAS